jgi:hypothetical protein
MKNKLLTIVLAAAFILIWGIIIYKIVIYFTSLDNSDTELPADNPAVILKQEENRIATDNYKISRDPFELYAVKTEKTLSGQETLALKAQRKFTKYKINGIIASAKSYLVILEDLTDKSVHFIRPGERYNEIKILKATPKAVTITVYEDVKEIEF